MQNGSQFEGSEIVDFDAVPVIICYREKTFSETGLWVGEIPNCICVHKRNCANAQLLLEGVSDNLHVDFLSTETLYLIPHTIQQ